MRSLVVIVSRLLAAPLAEKGIEDMPEDSSTLRHTLLVRLPFSADTRLAPLVDVVQTRRSRRRDLRQVRVRTALNDSAREMGE